MIGYLLAIFPIYIFIYLPLSQFLGLSSSSLSSDLNEISFNESFIAPEDPALVCLEHSYTTHILSREPLVLYLEGFLGEVEIEHLLEISNDQFETSRVSTGSEQFIDPSIRQSEVATLPRSHTVQCIEARARALQGWGRPFPPSSFYQSGYFQSRSPPSHSRADGPSRSLDQHAADLQLERLKIQRYGPGGHYTHHYDWQGAGRVDRASSFMVYVDANCTGGGTGFPRLPRPPSKRWCRWIECEDEDEDEDEDERRAVRDAAGAEAEGTGTQSARPGEGVVFKPVRGNAVFWENLRADGTGYVETWHAGLPVETGRKIGLNIWSWYRF